MRADSILIIDDEQLVRWSLGQELTKDQYPTLEAENLAEGLIKVANHEPDLIIVDQRLPDGTGIDFIKALKEQHYAAPVILLTGFDRSDVAVQAMKLGAYDYLTKPINFEELKITIGKALEETKLRRQLARIRSMEDMNHGNCNLVSSSPSMKKVLEFIARVAQTDSTTVLITGESGTGKELVARAIHCLGSRKDMPFMVINCPAIPENLIESELFGHEKGAFTDARSQRKGLFELSDGGTVFLDEIGDMAFPLQVSLLRVIEQKTFHRVGGSVDISVNVRIIAATNQNLEQQVESGHFRKDLYYRLNVASITLPPLRERGDDSVLLATHFLQQLNETFHKGFRGLTNEASEQIRKYAWPGNVRELKNVMERAVLIHDDEYIRPAHIKLGSPGTPGFKNGVRSLALDGTSSSSARTRPLSLTEIERQAIEDALVQSNHNQSRAARLLHISRDTLRYRMKKHRIC